MEGSCGEGPPGVHIPQIKFVGVFRQVKSVNPSISLPLSILSPGEKGLTGGISADGVGSGADSLMTNLVLNSLSR